MDCLNNSIVINKEICIICQQTNDEKLISVGNGISRIRNFSMQKKDVVSNRLKLLSENGKWNIKFFLSDKKSMNNLYKINIKKNYNPTNDFKKCIILDF